MRATLYLLLSAVAAAAAVLSFAALRDLALLCGFAPALAPLLPVVVDAGAAAGTLVWLGGHAAQDFARRLALTLLGVSIAANALSHGAGAWAAGSPWWVVGVACVASGLAPAVLGAVIHLAVRYRQAADAQQPPDDLQLPGEIAGPPTPDVEAEPPAGDPGGLALPGPPSRDEPDHVLVADLRVVDATRRAEGLGPLPIGDKSTGIRARYGVGYPRGSRLRRAADTPHLVPGEERVS